MITTDDSIRHAQYTQICDWMICMDDKYKINHKQCLICSSCDHCDGRCIMYNLQVIYM